MFFAQKYKGERKLPRNGRSFQDRENYPIRYCGSERESTRTSVFRIFHMKMPLFSLFLVFPIWSFKKWS